MIDDKPMSEDVQEEIASAANTAWLVFARRQDVSPYEYEALPKVFMSAFIQGALYMHRRDAEE